MKKILNSKLIRKYGKSLQFRIFIIFILVGIIPINLMKYGILSGYKNMSIRQRTATVQRQCENIADQLGESDYLSGSSSEIIEMELNQLADLYSGRIVIVNSAFRIVRDTYDLDEQKVIVSEEVIK